MRELYAVKNLVFTEKLHWLTLSHRHRQRFRDKVCPEKRDQNVFCNVFYKTRAILMKFGNRFLNKFAAN